MGAERPAILGTRRVISRRSVGATVGVAIAGVVCLVVCAPPLAVVVGLGVGALALARLALLPAMAVALVAAAVAGVVAWQRWRQRNHLNGGVVDSPNDGPPIACTLTPDDLRDRAGAWRRLLASGLVARKRVPGGVRLTPQPGAAAMLVELVELERHCCAWMKIDIADDSVVTITADGAGVAVLFLMFLPQPTWPSGKKITSIQ